ncbi:hypothetical protein AVEN_246519-1 [Araneus ventricosus]|uniref:Uncharacterized protein n=1 Tax=Araneus ventricosus TaxID=182803 RepID=A0A4Y2LTX4_ARAVE|nr:hypothetical protein AVEN_246519-1 [Araneus ventricosus]
MQELPDLDMLGRRSRIRVMQVFGGKRSWLCRLPGLGGIWRTAVEDMVSGGNGGYGLGGYGGYGLGGYGGYTALEVDILVV